jgi:DNA repair protein SbcC/Rad50
MELNVIENYQSGEIRSTKNLTGDESFIGSLSLALGPSQMASRYVRVDSFFLNEGFGSLDGETFETVLSILVELHQASKLIGVLSQSRIPRSASGRIYGSLREPADKEV